MKNQTNTAWTPELKDRVKALWATYSAAQIAGALNSEGYTFSRNSIIGVLHRANLTSTHKTEEHPRSRNAGQRRRSPANHSGVTKVSPAEIKLRCVEIVPRNLTLIDLEPADCRYPTTEDAPFLFCGHPKQAGSQYCTPHHHLCWVPPISNAPKARKYYGTDFAA